MNKKLIIASIIIGLGLFSLIGAFALGPKENKGDSITAGEAIGVINIEGVITGGSGAGSILDGGGAGSDTLMEQLKEARENPDIKALVLRINSPGGSAPASQEIGEEVDKVRKAGKKVIVSMGDITASGGYWIAAKADKIVANPATMTGSIGVIMEFQNLQELYGKVGVKPVTIKSGLHKDIGSANRPMTAEEEKILQTMVNDIYEQFIDVVAEGRKMDREKVRKLADGRVFTGRQAKDIGLVDQMGNYYDAIKVAGKLAGIKGEPEVIELGDKSPFDAIFSNVSAARGLYGSSQGLSQQELAILKKLLARPLTY